MLLLGLGRLDRNRVFKVSDDLTNLDKAIDLFAEKVLKLLFREGFEIDGGGLFATLLRGLLFLFERGLVIVRVVRLVTLVVVLI